jgi:hypothetical protein
MVWQSGSLAVAQPDDEHSDRLPACRQLEASRLRRAVDVQRISLQMQMECGGQNSDPLIG